MTVRSASDAIGKVFELGDVKDGTAGKVFGETIGVQVEADFHGVFAGKGHVVIGDFVVSAIGKAEAEWLEGFRLKHFTHLFGCNHEESFGIGSLYCKPGKIASRLLAMRRLFADTHF